MPSRITKALILFLTLTMTLSAASVSGQHLEDTFESEDNLRKFSFSSFEEGERDFLENTRFFLQTTEAGDEIYSWFGHSGLSVENEKYGISKTFDWGVFAFSPTFYLDFIFGRLYYSLMVSPSSYSLSKAEWEDRKLTRVELMIPLEAKKDVINFLNYNSLSENSTYLYHHYEDNCATRIRDIYDAATGGAFRTWAEGISTGRSYRDFTTEIMYRNFPVNWTLNFLQGPSVDTPLTLWEACFLPEVLEKAIMEYSSAESSVLYESTRSESARKGNLVAESAVAGLIAAAFLIYTYKCHRRIWALIMSLILTFLTVLSLVLIFMMCFSNHDVTYFNENIVIVNPLLIIPLCSALRCLFGKKGREAALCLSSLRVFFCLSLALLVAKGLFMGTLHQDNLAQILFVMALYATGFRKRS
ncbi:MAG: DUF4105 domain-containing protein [Bullifex sp.]|nr:DUF4105 domain-containing protein [Bullifex sp.]